MRIAPRVSLPSVVRSPVAQHICIPREQVSRFASPRLQNPAEALRVERWTQYTPGEEGVGQRGEFPTAGLC